MSDPKNLANVHEEDDSDEDDVDYHPGLEEGSDASHSASEDGSSDEDVHGDDDDDARGEDGEKLRVPKKRRASDDGNLESNKTAKTGDTLLTSEEEEKRKQELWLRLNSANGQSADSSKVNETTKDTEEGTEETKKAISTSATSKASVPVVRKAGGVSNLLAKLGKKKESTLAKSKSDWDEFKRREGIEEELTEHTKSKGSFIERQEFLQRTDQRQFEQEKSVRDKIRSRNLP